MRCHYSNGVSIAVSYSDLYSVIHFRDDFRDRASGLSQKGRISWYSARQDQLGLPGGGAESTDEREAGG